MEPFSKFSFITLQNGVVIRSVKGLNESTNIPNNNIFSCLSRIVGGRLAIDPTIGHIEILDDLKRGTPSIEMMIAKLVEEPD